MITIKQDMIVFTAPEIPVPVPEETRRANTQAATRYAAVELPTIALDQMLGLTEAELKVLLFIVRQTAGYGHENVTLTYNQIAYGVYGDDGRLLDRGTGLCHKSIGRGVRLLSDKGYINVQPIGRPRRRANISPSDLIAALGTAGIYSLGQRMCHARNWIEQPQPKPVPEARYGVKTPRAA